MEQQGVGYILWDIFTTMKYSNYFFDEDDFKEELSLHRLDFRNNLDQDFIEMLTSLEQDTVLWKFARTWFVTTSSISSALGIRIRLRFNSIVDPYNTIKDTWEFFTNKKIKEDVMNDAMLRGKLGESNIRENLYMNIMQVYVKTTGLHVACDCPYVAASPDGLIGEEGGLEIKYPNSIDGSIIRTDHYIQCQVNLHCCKNRKWWDLCLFCNATIDERIGCLYIFRIYKSDEYWQWLLKGINYFVSCVVLKKEPLEAQCPCFCNVGEPKQNYEIVIDKAFVVDKKDVFIRKKPNPKFNINPELSKYIMDSDDKENYVRKSYGLKQKRKRDPNNTRGRGRGGGVGGGGGRGRVGDGARGGGGGGGGGRGAGGAVEEIKEKQKGRRHANPESTIKTKQ